MFEQPINDNNFIQIAMHHYDNPQCVNIAEFEEDIKRFSYLKKLFHRYKENKDLKERLILNHLTILHNVFGIITPDLLFFKTEKLYWDILGTFLIFLGTMPDTMSEFDICKKDIKVDLELMAKLKEL